MNVIAEQWLAEQTTELARKVIAYRAALETIVDFAGACVTDAAGTDRTLALINETANDALAEDMQAAPVDAAANMLVAACHSASVNAGWWHDIRTGESLIHRPHIVGEKLALIHSEISEAMEGHRKGLRDDKLPDRPMIEVELADAVIRIADLAGVLGLDLGGAIKAKMAFNAVRPDHKPEARLAAGGKAY